MILDLFSICVLGLVVVSIWTTLAMKSGPPKPPSPPPQNDDDGED